LLASVRLRRVRPGSAVLELDPPTSLQVGLDGIAPSADEVAVEFIHESNGLITGEPSPDRTGTVRRLVRQVLVDAGEIGSLAEIALNPVRPLAGLPKAALVATVPIKTMTEIEEPRATERRKRKVVGHAYMVDVEPGRERLRMKLTDGRDLTLDVEEGISPESVKSALDHAVEVSIEEELGGPTAARPTMTELNVLPPAGRVPQRTIVELMVEQGLPANRPDYQALATAVWSTDEELAEFDEYLREMRQSEVSSA